jgi:PPK2 family polyphosphate:nucleotide phosphotransferase
MHLKPVKPGDKVHLDKIPTDSDGGLNKDDAEDMLEKHKERLAELQEVLYASQNRAILIVLQAMDTGGKDSTIRSVFTGFNPQGCRVVSFKAPNETEREHDFLWRIHQHVPQDGYITVFNRSHYEDVLVVRVKGLAPKSRWQARYDEINAFEKMLHGEGTVIVKFFLHISKAYQKERLQRRLDNPDKLWKFNPQDLVERGRWHEYQRAYEDAIEKCSTEHAPWYIVPAETRWFRNLAIAATLVKTMELLKLEYPEPQIDPAKITID